MNICFQSFKKYAFGVWKIPHIQSFCITVQNQHSVCVPLLLFAIWCKHQNHTISVKKLIPICKAFEKQHILPVRNQRISVKHSNPELYEKLKKQELEKEIQLMHCIVQNATESVHKKCPVQQIQEYYNITIPESIYNTV